MFQVHLSVFLFNMGIFYVECYMGLLSVWVGALQCSGPWGTAVSPPSEGICCDHKGTAAHFLNTQERSSIRWGPWDVI